MAELAVFTIASQNYVAYVRTLMASVAEQHPEYDRYLLLVDEPEESLDLSRENYIVILAKDIGIDDFYGMAFKYDIMEFNTAVKPFFFKWLFQKQYKKVIYFDPDIYVYNKLDLITYELDRSAIVLTPHNITPFPEDSLIPDDQELLRAGIYNLGFIALSNTEESQQFCEWWACKCNKSCYNEFETGLFVDQKWVNLVNAYFDSITVLKHLGCNVAYWNLHERKICDDKINGKYPLIFYHFSGIDPLCSEQISKYQNRYSLDQRPDLQELFLTYRKKLINNAYQELSNLKYSYACYDNGVSISPLARRLYADAPVCASSPFSTCSGSYYELLHKCRLKEKKASYVYSKNNTWKERRRLEKLIKILARVIGSEKYCALMKYLRFVTVLRKQRFLFE
jgi:hypothetical protein